MSRPLLRDLHWLIALREKHRWVGVIFFSIGVIGFGYLMVDAFF